MYIILQGLLPLMHLSGMETSDSVTQTFNMKTRSQEDQQDYRKKVCYISIHRHPA